MRERLEKPGHRTSPGRLRVLRQGGSAGDVRARWLARLGVARTTFGLRYRRARPERRPERSSTGTGRAATACPSGDASVAGARTGRISRPRREPTASAGFVRRDSRRGRTGSRPCQTSHARDVPRRDVPRTCPSYLAPRRAGSGRAIRRPEGRSGWRAAGGAPGQPRPQPRCRPRPRPRPAGGDTLVRDRPDVLFRDPGRSQALRGPYLSELTSTPRAWSSRRDARGIRARPRPGRAFTFQVATPAIDAPDTTGRGRKTSTRQQSQPPTQPKAAQPQTKP
jgi:hypothetical protein